MWNLSVVLDITLIYLICIRFKVEVDSKDDIGNVVLLLLDDVLRTSLNIFASELVLNVEDGRLAIFFSVCIIFSLLFISSLICVFYFFITNNRSMMIT